MILLMAFTFCVTLRSSFQQFLQAGSESGLFALRQAGREIIIDLSGQVFQSIL